MRFSNFTSQAHNLNHFLKLSEIALSYNSQFLVRLISISQSLAVASVPKQKENANIFLCIKSISSDNFTGLVVIIHIYFLHIFCKLSI